MQPIESPFTLIETMYFKHRICYLEDHLTRLQHSAGAFQVPFNRTLIVQTLNKALTDVLQDQAYRVRLTLDTQGKAAVTKTVLNRETPASTRVLISPDLIDAENPYFYHKTSRRRFYNDAYKKAVEAGYYEVLFFNTNGHLTEGSISNVFIKLNGQIYTPPVECGLLAGIYRQQLLKRCSGIQECVINREDFQNASAIYVCNAVRGLRKVTLN